MCGIFGQVAPPARGPIDRQTLCRQCDTMHHRGPDDSGVWLSSDGRVGLGHRRLSIIDLSPLGHQPMSDATGQLQIVFNGEIYNFQELRAELEGLGHVFRSHSDTEVILAAYRQWDVDCVGRLNGMFAIGLYDAPRRRLMLARDAAGEKPLFYRHSDGGLTFASELKAMLADPAMPRQLDMQSLDYYLAYGFVPGDRCMLKGVAKLPQGHMLLYDIETDRLTTSSYWQLPRQGPCENADPRELSQELERLLMESVRLRLIADVPVGVLLSGGLDSSLVTAAAAKVSSKRLKTFTISFPGHGGFDEAPFARMVADHFGTEHTELAAEPASVDLLDELARQYDEPIADHSMVPTYLISRLIRQHATVALGGDGGDELFGGYPHYNWLIREDRWRRRLPGLLRRGIGAVGRALPVGVRGRTRLLGLSGDAGWGIAHVNMYFDCASRRRLLGGAWDGSAFGGGVPEHYKAGLCRSDQSLLHNATAVDFMTYLVDDILVKVDRASMLTSLEVRAPFLDRHIIDFAFSQVRDGLRADAGGRKILLRLLGQRLLPSQLDLRRKQGFTIPLASWFKGPWGQTMRDVLSSSDGLLDRGFIKGMLRDQERGLKNINRLFCLTIFELWRRQYRISV